MSQLRDIEIEIGSRLELADEELGPTEREALLKMQQILYATEVSRLALNLRTTRLTSMTGTGGLRGAGRCGRGSFGRP